MFHMDLRDGKFLVLVRKWSRHERQYLLSKGSDMDVPGIATIWNKHDRGTLIVDEIFYAMDGRTQKLGIELTRLPEFRRLFIHTDRLTVCFIRDVGTSDTELDDLDQQLAALIGYCLAPGIKVKVEIF
ncbi:MAG: hypothetical protein J0M07_24560 [Anaerolineae bacterium]|jgi:hypothetical protein|nr:hypothetical protein [Anaerolineae bacterium]